MLTFLLYMAFLNDFLWQGLDLGCSKTYLILSCFVGTFGLFTLTVLDYKVLRKKSLRCLHLSPNGMIVLDHILWLNAKMYLCEVEKRSIMKVWEGRSFMKVYIAYRGFRYLHLWPCWLETSKYFLMIKKGLP